MEVGQPHDARGGGAPVTGSRSGVPGRGVADPVARVHPGAMLLPDPGGRATTTEPGSAVRSMLEEA